MPWEGGPKGCVIARYTHAITGEPRGIWRRPIKKDAKPRTLGEMAGCVIRLWPNYDVTIGLVLAEGVESAAAASLFEHRGTLLQPAWAAGCADNMEKFPVLPGVKCLTSIVTTIAAAPVKTRQRHVRDAGRCWREVIRLTPKIVGEDFRHRLQDTGRGMNSGGDAFDEVVGLTDLRPAKNVSAVGWNTTKIFCERTANCRRRTRV